MKTEYVTHIAELDKTLKMLSDMWKDEKDKKKITQFRSRIDSMLDERLRLMKLRDA